MGFATFVRLRRTLATAVCVGFAAMAMACGRTDEASEGNTSPDLREFSRIGTAEGGSALSFGLVGDIAVHGGRMFVLDVAKKHVSVLTMDGKPVGILGRRGHGPGEFEEPVALAADEQGTLYVLDRANQRIEVWNGSSDPVMRLGSIPVDFPAEDLCTPGDRLFLLGARGGRLIHEMQPSTGRILRSFAPDSGSEDPLMRSYRANGYLQCGPGDELVFLPMLRPEVRRFSASTGAPLGTSELPGYRAVRVSRSPEGGVRFEGPEGGRHDYGSSVAPVPGGDRLIQVGLLRRGARTSHEFDSIRSFLLSPSNAVREVSGELPRVLAVRGDTAFAVTTDPFPAISLLRWTHTP